MSDRPRAGLQVRRLTGRPIVASATSHCRSNWYRDAKPAREHAARLLSFSSLAIQTVTIASRRGVVSKRKAPAGGLPRAQEFMFNSRHEGDLPRLSTASRSDHAEFNSQREQRIGGGAF